MTTPRIEQLLSFLPQRPDDPFVVYALAIEYKNAVRLDDALRYFSEVHTRFPDYVPNYLHFGGLLTERGETAEARRILEQGMTKARSAGDGHALSELAEALDLLEAAP